MRFITENIEILGAAAAILGTISLVPQVIKTLSSKSTKSISLSMYVIIFIDSLLWLTYGFNLSIRPLIIQSLITATCGLLMIIMKMIWKED